MTRRIGIVRSGRETCIEGWKVMRLEPQVSRWLTSKPVYFQNYSAFFYIQKIALWLYNKYKILRVTCGLYTG